MVVDYVEPLDSAKATETDVLNKKREQFDNNLKSVVPLKLIDE